MTDEGAGDNISLTNISKINIWREYEKKKAGTRSDAREDRKQRKTAGSEKREKGGYEMKIGDAPYIRNYMATGEEYPRELCARQEEAEERLYMLEDERRDVEEFMGLSIELKEDVLDHYDTEIRECERTIAYFENMRRR